MNIFAIGIFILFGTSVLGSLVLLTIRTFKKKILEKKELWKAIKVFYIAGFSLGIIIILIGYINLV